MSQFIDDRTYRRHAREQEGFARMLDPTGDVIPTCASYFNGCGTNLADFRGAIPNPSGGVGQSWLPAPASLERRFIEWETTAAPEDADTVFTWIAGSQVSPMRAAFPYATAVLSVDGKARVRFPVGWPNGFRSTGDGLELVFEPKRFQSLVESPHRHWDAHGVSGFYRLHVPKALIHAGKPLRLRVDVEDAPRGAMSFFYLAPRRDALALNLATLRDEITRLQTDVTQLRLSHEMLYAQQYPDLFPERLKGERVIVHQDSHLHYHPATVTALRSGEVIITAREGTDHLSQDGRIVLFRSRDGGRSWGPRESLYDLGKSDHRCAPIVELPNGDWLTTDYRAGREYNADGVWDIEHMTGPTLWGAWSSDQGKSWSFTDQPMVVPGMHPYAEIERHIIRLPTGRLLVAANCMPLAADGVHPVPHAYQIAVFCSDDSGRHWHVLSRLPDHPWVVGECTMLYTRDGRVLLLARSQPNGGEFTERGALLQSVSTNDGLTWTPLTPTAMSSMGSPGHLLQLRDGRIACTHASRHYPGSIYITLSHDNGRTWDTDRTRVVACDIQNFDSCYPNSAQLTDGTILTTWYSNLFGKFYIAVFRSRPEAL